MAEMTIKLPGGGSVVLPEGSSQEQVAMAIRAMGGGGRTQVDAKAAGEAAMAAEYDRLSPLEKMIVGFRGATRSASAGINDVLGTDPEGVAAFEAQERPALEPQRAELGYGTVGEALPNIVAPGRLVVQSGVEGLLEGLKAPEGQRLQRGIEAAGGAFIGGKIFDEAGKGISRLRETRRLKQNAERLADQAGQPIVSEVDLVTTGTERPAAGTFSERAAGITDDVVAATDPDGLTGEGMQAAERYRLADRADDLGLEVTAGQRYGNRPRQQLEASLASNPLTSGPYNEIAENNATRYAEIAARAIGEDADALTPAVLGNASDRLGGEFRRVSSELNDILPNVLEDRGTVGTFLNRIRTAAKKETGDIRNQRLTYGKIPGEDAAIETIEENLKVAPMVQVIRHRLGARELDGDQLMNIRSSLVDEISTVRKLGGGGASGSQIMAMGDMVDAIDNLIVDAARASGYDELAGDYAVARTQYRVLQAMEHSRVTDPLGDVRARTVDAYMRREYPMEYRRGGLTGTDPERSLSVQSLADFMDATRIGSSVTQDIVGNSGTATRQFMQNMIMGDVSAQGLIGMAIRGTAGSGVGRLSRAIPGAAAPSKIPALIRRAGAAGGAVGSEGFVGEQ